jgi:hypothetical protein
LTANVPYGNVAVTGNLYVNVGSIYESYNGTFYNMVSQADIGSNPNQIPLNQYLGSFAYIDYLDVLGPNNDLIVVSPNVGINISSPTSTLHVVGTSNITSSVILGPSTFVINGTSNTITSNTIAVLNTGSIPFPAIQIGATNRGFYNTPGGAIGAVGAGYEQARFGIVSNTVNFLLLNGANTGNGPTLTVGGTDANISLILASNSSGSIIFTSNAAEVARINTSGLGIGTKVPTSNLHVVGTSNVTSTAVFGANVGVGTSNPIYNLQVVGSFAATTKSFIIKHPLKSGKFLRYGSLEGPENGVYVRGRTQSNIIELPDYWTALVDSDTITVNLTPIGSTKMPSVISANSSVVTIKKPMFGGIDCYYIIYAERKDVDKLTVEV